MDLDSCEAFKAKFLKAKVRRDTLLYGHKAVLLGHLVYAWGGYHETTDKNRLYILNLQTKAWTVKPVANNTKGGHKVTVMFLEDDFIYALAFQKPNNTPAFFVKVDSVLKNEVVNVSTRDTPQLNSRCAGAFLDEMCELLVVGAGGTVFALNLGSLSWKEVPTTGQGPISEGDHACCSYRNVLYVAGGHPRQSTGLDLHILTVSRNSYLWSSPRVALGSIVPLPRKGLTLTCSSPDRIFAFGGSPSYDNLDMFNIRTNQWYSLREKLSSSSHMLCAGGTKGGTSRHAAVHTQNFLLVIGGFGTNYWLSSPMMIEPL